MSRRKKNRGSRLKKRKQTLIALAKQINSESTQYRWQEKTAKDATTKKLIAQFGSAADPTLSTWHNASTTLATMPTWYYFSRPSNLALHDFTKQHKPEKNLRSLLGLGLKFIPTPSLTNSWSRLRTSSYDRVFCSVHLCFHFAGKPPNEVTTSYDPKLMSDPNGHLHIGRFPPSHSRNVSSDSPLLSTNYSKLVKAKQIYCHTNIEHYVCCNNNRCS